MSIPENIKAMQVLQHVESSKEALREYALGLTDEQRADPKLKEATYHLKEAYGHAHTYYGETRQ